VCALCFTLQSRGALAYPSVAAGHWVFNVPDVSSANVSALIRSRTGVPLYHLQCHSAGYTGDSDFDYSGEFECRLSSVGDHDLYSTLLTEDANQNRDWESRARFFAADVIGKCANIPQFGSVRHFRLRGMQLTLKIVDPVVNRNRKLVSLKLKVAVQPDPTADREIAAIVQLPKGAPGQCLIHRYFPNPANYTNDK